MLRCWFGTEGPGDVPTVADLMIHCQERDLALPLKLTLDLTMQRLLVGLLLRRSPRLDRQEEVGPLLLELSRNGFSLWSASAWIRTPP